mmetsp:Transcript_30057/g.66093  ORF Transcript_30057/g.66093 Transcript_30057/m.66093 type:complete len:262 (+) Transcript_30057:226-1011(+)
MPTFGHLRSGPLVQPSLQGVADQIAIHSVRAPVGVDRGVQVGRTVHPQDGVQVVVVGLQAVLELVCGVVAAVGQAAHNLLGRGLELEVVDRPGLRVEASAADALLEDAVGDVQGQEAIRDQPLLLHELSLHSSPRHPINDPTLRRVLHSVLQQINHQRIRHQRPLVHELLRLLPQGRPVLHVLTQKVPGTDVLHAEQGGELLALGTLAGAGGTEQDELQLVGLGDAGLGLGLVVLVVAEGTSSCANHKSGQGVAAARRLSA